MIINFYPIGSGGSGSGGTYTLPTATANRLGGVKIGEGINVANDGTISVSGGTGGGEELNYQIVDTLDNAVPNVSGMANDIIIDFTEYTGDPYEMSFEIMNPDLYGDDSVIVIYYNGSDGADIQIMLYNWVTLEEGVVYGEDYGLPFSFTASNNLPNNITLHLLDGPLPEGYEMYAYYGATASTYSGPVGTFKEGTMVYSQSGSTKYTYKDGWNPEEKNLLIKVNSVSDLYNGTITPVEGMIAYVPKTELVQEYTGTWGQYQAGRHEGNPITGMTIVKLCFSNSRIYY